MTSSELYSEIELSTASDFLDAIKPWGAVDSSGYIFRGHWDDGYDLLPGALRADQRNRLRDLAGAARPIAGQADWEYWQVAAEWRLLRKFYELADRRGLSVPASNWIRQHRDTELLHLDYLLQEHDWIHPELAEVASLAQHYGLPTRLLDWSHDPFIASFFAAGKENRAAGHLSVWALNASELHFHEGSTVSSKLRFVTPPYAENPNLAAQHGIFTYWSVKVPPVMLAANVSPATMIDRTPLDKLLRDHYTAHPSLFGQPLIRKYRLPATEADELRKLLFKSGYGHSKLFPGYDGVSRELESRSVLKM